MTDSGHCLWRGGADAGRRGCPPAPPSPPYCEDNCSGHGHCVGDVLEGPHGWQAPVCVCDEGYTGVACAFDVCPRNCSDRGECIAHVCKCDPQFGGPDCSLDRLDIFAEEMMSKLDLSMGASLAGGDGDVGPGAPPSCLFLTAQDVTPFGDGGRAEFWSDITKSREVYDVPQEMEQVLPADCPVSRFATCAVVGNSGSLRFAELGPAIDGHEMVYRFNQAPTHGFERHVGAKTTFESLNAKFAHALARDGEGSATGGAPSKEWLWRDPLAVFVMFEPLKLREAYVAIRQHFPVVDALLFSPAFFVHAHRIYDALQDELELHEFGCFSGEKPMSGFYAVLFALQACDQVDLYGFDPWTDALAKHSQGRYHYFDNDKPRPGAHSFDATFFMYTLLAKGNPKLRIHTIAVPRAEAASRGEGEEYEGEAEEDAAEEEDKDALAGDGDEPWRHSGGSADGRLQGRVADVVDDSMREKASHPGSQTGVLDIDMSKTAILSQAGDKKVPSGKKSPGMVLSRENAYATGKSSQLAATSKPRLQDEIPLQRRGSIARRNDGDDAKDGIGMGLEEEEGDVGEIDG
eukprot:jgi/Mesvir1/3639/Mv14938-RA.3